MGDHFSAQTLAFLKGLSANNNKAWFDAHRADYEAHYIAPAKEFVSALGPPLQQLSPGLQAEPRVNGSIFRINRDVRFSKDKTPYKDHLDLWFWEGESRSFACSGLFFRLRAKQLILGAGMHRFDKPWLERYRAAVLDEAKGKALVTLLKKAEQAGYAVGGDNLKKVPRGFDAAHPRADKLLFDSLTLSVELPLPKEALTPAFPKFCLKHFKAMLPLHSWLCGLPGK